MEFSPSAVIYAPLRSAEHSRARAFAAVMATLMWQPCVSAGSDQTGCHVSVRGIHVPPPGAWCDVVEGGTGVGGDLTMRGMCATLVSVYLKDAN